MKLQAPQTSLSEINVTPLVDVMLVLLIVFMISAPMMQQGVQINVPKANTGALNAAPDQVFISINQNRKVFFNQAEIPSASLRPKLEAIVSIKPQVEVFIKADGRLPYSTIAYYIAEVKKAKVTKLGLVTEPGDTKPGL